MSRRETPSNAAAISVLSWLVNQHSDDPGRDMISGKSPSNETRIGWLKQGRQADWLAISTNRREPWLLENAGFVEPRRCAPSILKLTATKQISLMAYPAYKLSVLGVALCLAMLECELADESSVLEGVVEAALIRPDAVTALYNEVAEDDRAGLARSYLVGVVGWSPLLAGNASGEMLHCRAYEIRRWAALLLNFKGVVRIVNHHDRVGRHDKLATMLAGLPGLGLV